MPSTKVAPRTYTFDQLGPKGKSRAIEQYRDDSRERDDGGQLYELLASDLEDVHGLTYCKLSYSLGYCQGDGVAFAGNPGLEEWARHDEHLAGLLTALTAWAVLCGEEEPQLSVKITTDGHYSHWNSMTLELTNDADWPTNANIVVLDNMVSDIEVYLTQAIKDISRKLEKTGYAEIEHRDSDEAISDTLIANEYEFTRSGEQI